MYPVLTMLTLLTVLLTGTLLPSVQGSACYGDKTTQDCSSRSHKYAECSISGGTITGMSVKERYSSSTCVFSTAWPAPSRRGADGLFGYNGGKIWVHHGCRANFYVCFSTDGGYTTWSTWSACTATCGSGTKSRTRSCTNPAPFRNGRNCDHLGSDTDSTSCSLPQCPIDGGYTTWSAWSSCSQTCGREAQTRTRSCTDPEPQHLGADCSGLGSDTETQSCGHVNCPIDGGYTSWSAWSSCSQTCGDEVQTRTRSCTEPAPQHLGADCSGLGSDTETQTCGHVDCPIDGGFSAWSAWSSCPVTCSSSIVTITRSRTCTAPEPQYGGANCTDAYSETKTCNIPECPIDGGYTTWSAWSSCSQTCGKEVQTRTRSCTDPEPQHLGADCSALGSDTETESCGHVYCPIDGGFTTWSEWSACSVTCGSLPETISRIRTCTDPEPQYNGANCTGDYTETTTCDIPQCPVDGGYTTWSAWSACSATCGNETMTRTRDCTDPEPLHGGLNCSVLGEASETQSCGHSPCPIDGGFTPWSAWSACSVTCGNITELISRTRSCTDPDPQHGGANCTGNDYETDVCDIPLCPIDGGYSTWTAWSACSRTCGNEVQTRTRGCTDPEPQHGGADCLALGEDTDTQSCDHDHCPIDGNWGPWVPVSSCSASCLGGLRNRTRTCDDPEPQYGGANCTGDAFGQEVCNEFTCDILPPVDGNWGTWSGWQGCSVTCDTGVRRRYRDCDDPAAANNGLPCYGDGYEELACTPGPSCPVTVHGNWGAWTSLSPCSATCDYGYSLKARSCNDPLPANGGRDCVGESMVLSQCFISSCNTSITPGDSASNSSIYGTYVNLCPDRYFTCFSGSIRCVENIVRCDCVADCEDNSDEIPEWSGCNALVYQFCQSAAEKGFHNTAVILLMCAASVIHRWF